MKYFFLVIGFCIGFFFSIFLIARITERYYFSSHNDLATSTQFAASIHTSSSQCDSATWNHIYHPQRLQMRKPCVTITGIIVKKKREPDGDDHIQLHLDSEYTRILNEKNKSSQNANLVIEPICQHIITQKDAKAACEGYNVKFAVPAIGTHVEVLGDYVLDTQHGWMELHPVYLIKEIK